MNSETYIQTLKEIRSDIINSRYQIARLANKEMLFLYYRIGGKISEKVTNEKWGNKTIEKLSNDLQYGMKGLRGFSYGSLRKMRIFYDEWAGFFQKTGLLEEICSLTTNKLDAKNIHKATNPTEQVENTFCSLTTNKFAELYTLVSFTAHYEIITKTKDINERIFYISKAALEFWTVDTLKHQLKNNLYKQESSISNNFDVTLNDQYRKKALRSFKDQYLFDFIRISDEDEDDERILENEIVQNIKKFIMSIGNDFAFIGNQFRIIVEDDEYFIDLLFYNRSLQALVAFELKTGKFKPEYLGKMNFYLSALDEYIKKPNENPSIGIILCKEKKNKVVEFSFRDVDKAMGVATYKTSSVLPNKFRESLPDEETLRKLLD